ncbi:MAG: aspartate kinase [Defluviitaleaceae bacterium]|nr:aspartate kinase [Defluviitaleaceae bacterium]
MLTVQKYGGSSVADEKRIANVAARIAECYNEGNQVIVILSAQGDTTDNLIELASKVSSRPSAREMDMLISTGEQQSVALMALALHEIGIPAVSLNANQIGMLTTGVHRNARIKSISSERIYKELENKNVVLIAGFQGYCEAGNITTLGRGGSDTTAVAVAAAMTADLCEIYTDVDGIYTADPRLVDDARKLETITYDEMLEMASLGANVLHNRSVELAKNYAVRLVVRSSMTNAPGTLIKEEGSLENTLVSGITVDKNVARVSVCEIVDKPGMAFKLFDSLADNGVAVDMILQSVGRDGTKDISFTVAKGQREKTLSVLETRSFDFGYSSYDDSIVKLSIVGVGIATNPKVASQMFGALYDANVNIDMISTSEMKLSVLINEKDLVRGMNSVHERFFKKVEA